jgi:RHS repeat-associated protein
VRWCCAPVCLRAWVLLGGTLPAARAGGAVQYLHHDQQGSTRLLTGASGNVEGKCSYGAYGAPACEGTATTPLGYDGQYTSSDTGLIYLRNRVYDPATTQFLSVDPAVSITQEPYAYAADDSVNLTDRTGLEAFPIPVPVAGGCAAAPEICAGVAVGGVDVYLGIKVFNAWAGEEESGNDEGTQELKEHENAECNAESIANGHAFDEHIDEFPGISTPKEFQERIEEVVENPTASKELARGRTAYYDEPTNTLVIEDPSNPDQGTAFKPDDGVKYYDELE